MKPVVCRVQARPIFRDHQWRQAPTLYPLTEARLEQKTSCSLNYIQADRRACSTLITMNDSELKQLTLQPSHQQVQKKVPSHRQHVGAG